MAPTVATQSASQSERRVSAALAAVLIGTTLIALPLSQTGIVAIPAFVPLFVGSTGMADALAAVLLFNLYRIDGRRLVLFGAAAYLFNALLIVPYGLTFPGMIDDRGFIGSVQSAAFLWLVWHASFASLLAAGTWPQGSLGIRRPVTIVGATIVAAIAIGTYATLGRRYLPIVIAHGEFTPLFQTAAVCLSLLSVFAAVRLFRGEGLSSLRLWLIVALVASALDTALNGIAPARYSAVWYLGKIEQFVSATVVLFSMLGAWSVAHARAQVLTERLAEALARSRVLQDGFDREHRASMAFQHAALPSELPAIAGLRFSALYRAASVEASVGGDWYDAFAIDDGRVVLSVGDVMGSGLEAAVTMNAVRQAMRGAAQLFPDPVAILDAADRALRSERPQAIVTACVAVLDTVTHSITYASAGHPAPMWRLPDGEVVPLGHSGLPLGVRPMRQDEPEMTETMMVPEPSMLVFYTDGLTEAMHDSLDGERRLQGVLRGPGMLLASDPATAIADAMLEDAFDDVAIMTVVVDSRPVPYVSNGDRRELTWTFTADDGMSAAVVRRDIVAHLVRAGAPEMETITAELVFSELVANVQRHCSCDVEVILDIGRAVPVLHVLDRGAGFSFVSRLPSSMMSESGRGLFIVSQVTRDFSVTVRPGGGSHARAVLAIALPVATAEVHNLTA